MLTNQREKKQYSLQFSSNRPIYSPLSQSTERGSQGTWSISGKRDPLADGENPAEGCSCLFPVQRPHQGSTPLLPPIKCTEAAFHLQQSLGAGSRKLEGEPCSFVLPGHCSSFRLILLWASWHSSTSPHH